MAALICRIYCRGKIIVYFRSIINAYFFFLYEQWVSLIKFMVKFTIHVREKDTYL